MGKAFLSLVGFLMAGSIVLCEPISLQLGPPPGDFRPDLKGFFGTLIKKFNSEHDGISVTLAEDDFGFEHLAATREQLGDVLFVPGPLDYGRGHLLAHYAAQGFLAPLDDLINDPEFDRTDFPENAWEAVRMDESVYGVPLLARGWALATSETLGSWEVDASNLGSLFATTSVTNQSDSQPSATGFLPNVKRSLIWEWLWLDAGGDRNHISAWGVNDSATLHAQSAFEQLIAVNPVALKKRGLTAPSGVRPDYPVQLVHDDGADTGAFPKLKAFGGAWQLHPLPGEGPVPPREYTLLAIRASDPEVVAAAWVFAKWLTSAEVYTAAHLLAGITPLRRSVVERSTKPETAVFYDSILRTAFQRPFPEARPAYEDHLKSIRDL